VKYVYTGTAGAVEYAAVEAARAAGRDSMSALKSAGTIHREQAELVREVFGNPFRPSRADAHWLKWNGGTVRALAEAAYDSSDFGLLPVLADALQEAGCADVNVLNHCRKDGNHVRGCWVLDLLGGRY
jgi:hypothetical protein